jgi:hypothetical protein
VKVNKQGQLPKTIPAWAKERVAELLEDGERITSPDAKLPDGFVKRALSDEQSVLNHWENRRSFARLKGVDNDPELNQDQDPAPNVVDLGWSKFHLNGNFSKGSVVQVVGDDAVNVTLHNGNVTTTADVRKDGSAFYRRHNAKDPGQSVALETATSKAERTENGVSEHFSATVPASELIKAPKGGSSTLEQQAANLFLTERDHIPEIREQLTTDIEAQVSGLPPEQQQKLKELLAKPNAHTPRRLSQELLRLAKEHPEQNSLHKLRDLSGTWQILEDAPKLMADGLLRTQEFYMPPAALQMRTAAQDWDFDKQTGLPIADSVIVGAGPGGLATGYHLSEQGQRTVIFEGGKIGQAFSDASAQSVHQLRTTSNSSDLIYTNSRTDLGIDVALRRNSEAIFDKGQQAKKSWNEQIGEADHSGNEGFGALNRNNLFEHMVHLGHGLATKYPDTFMLENSPITTITKVERGEETLFRVKSEQGHEVLTKSLVMATGFVGSNGEYARGLQQFSALEEKSPEAVTVLGSDHDLVGKNDQMLDREQALVFSDRLLGRPEVRQRIKSLPKGARLAVIGSGESAAKGAIEALHLNPDIRLDLYTKNPLEPYQVQIPVSHFGRAVTENAIQNKELADETLSQFAKLKTPITTETMKTLLSFEAEGRLQIREMGQRFNSDTVNVSLKSASEGGGFHVQLKSDEVAQNLREQRESWLESGLYGTNAPTDAPDELPDADMIMIAIGYDTQKVNAGPLMQQLIDQDVVEIKDGRVQYGEDGLTSSKCPRIGFNTASAVRMSSDTALPGRAVRGLRLAQNLAQKLPQREAPTAEESIRKGLPIGSVETQNPEEFPVPDLQFAKSQLSFKTNGFLPDSLEFARHAVEAPKDPEDRKWGEEHLDLEVKFAGPNSTVRALVGRYLEFPETLTPAEKLTAQRALEIAERLEKSE